MRSGRLRRSVGLALFAALAIPACNPTCGPSSSPVAAPPAPPTPSTVTPTQSTVVPTTIDPTTRSSGRPGIPGPFGEAVLVVTRPDGTTLEWCLLLALTDAARQQGLMYTTDATLGGYDGMVFRFGTDQTGGFWMRNTRLPLSIAFVEADGEIVRMLDMDPCPDAAATCPTYAPGASYRDAVEVPQGQFTRLGVTPDATLSFRPGSCPPV